MPVEKNPEINHPEAPFDFINLFEIAAADMDQFIAD